MHATRERDSAKMTAGIVVGSTATVWLHAKIHYAKTDTIKKIKNSYNLKSRRDRQILTSDLESAHSISYKSHVEVQVAKYLLPSVIN